MGATHLGRAVIACAVVIGIGASAQAAEPFRIGVVEDLNGTYSGNGGPNSVLATKMAVEDFGGTVLGRRSRSSRSIIRPSPTSASISPSS